MWPFKRKRIEFDDSTYLGRLINARVAVRHPLIDLDGESLEPSNDSVSGILNSLIINLEEAGESASKEAKMKHFEAAVVDLNRLDAKSDELIETVLREDLCETFNRIADATGIDYTKYGGGEGIASEWREW